LLAAIPGYGIGISARIRWTAVEPAAQPSFTQALRDFRSPSAVILALLLFFQFGNEWAIAGWLPLFLIRRVGVSPEGSLILLATYWLALLVGRVAVLAVLPGISHGRLLAGSLLAALCGCGILVSTDNRFGAVAGILLVGGGFASVYPLVVEKIGRRFPYYHPGFFNGIFALALTGGLLAPWSIGIFAQTWGVRAAMLVPALGTLMVFLLLIVLWAEAKFSDTTRPGRG
jgi:fucose permease